ncbi:hypothetical protein BH24ACT7_BH24ACT7_00660 [soil metagenome]
MDEAPAASDTSRRRMVAAVDGSAASRAALARAAEEARAHQGILQVVYAWNYLDQAHLMTFDPGYGEAEARAWLERFIDDVLPERPDDTELRLINDHAARALIDASVGAWTVVIGSRGMGGFKGLLMGSVSQQVVHHAHCAVLVIPTASEDN